MFCFFFLFFLGGGGGGGVLKYSRVVKRHLKYFMHEGNIDMYHLSEAVSTRFLD